MAWIKNDSNAPQYWGTYCVEKGAVGIIPAECIGPIMPRGVQVVSDDPERWVFRRTDHEPSNPRYRK